MLSQRGPKVAACRMFCSWNDMSQPLQSVLLGAALRKEMAWLHVGYITPCRSVRIGFSGWNAV